MAKINTIQLVRAVAAVLVLMTHCALYVESIVNFGQGTRPFHVAKWFDVAAGQFGVDLFFVVSGFIMIVTTHSNDRHNPLDFLRRRAIRIYPAWWIYSTAALLLLPISLFSLTPLDWSSIAKSYLLVPEIDSTGKLRPILLGQGWTLIFEMYFYSVFAIFVSKSTVQKAVLTSAIITLAFIGSRVVDFDLAILRVFSNAMVFEFMIGMLLGILFVKEFIIRSSLAFFAILILAIVSTIFILIGWEMGSGADFFQYAVTAFLWVALAVLFPRAKTARISKLAILLGDASYSIYLTHTIALILFSRMWTKGIGFNGWPLDVYFLFLVVTTMTIGILAYFVFEKPVIRWLGNRLRSDERTPNH